VELESVETNWGAFFSECTALKSAKFPKATFVDDRAFFQCTELTSIEILNVTFIGDSAFMLCSNLTSVALSGSFESDESYPFVSARGLQVVYAPAGSATEQWAEKKGYVVIDTNEE